MRGLIFSLNNTLSRWQSTIDVGATSGLFLRVLAATALINLIWLLPIADQVWGVDYFIILHSPFHGVKQAFLLLRIPEMRAYYGWFLYPCMFLLLMQAFGVSNFLSRLLNWIIYANLHHANYEMHNGGLDLLYNLLFLSIFLFEVKESVPTRWASAKRLIHHLAFYSIWMQIGLLYFSSGIHKLLGEHWLKGDAIFITLHLDEFTLPWIKTNLVYNNWFLVLSTWLSLAYQLLFVFLIWVKKTRTVFLAFGLLFHLAIAFIVGVTDFGLIMIASYTIFLSPKKAAKLLQALTISRWRRNRAQAKIMVGTGD
mgnify:CR=1 FL=1|jgi:hypothetical protein